MIFALGEKEKERERQQKERNCQLLLKIFDAMDSVTFKTTWSQVRREEEEGKEKGIKRRKSKGGRERDYVSVRMRVGFNGINKEHSIYSIFVIRHTRPY